MYSAYNYIWFTAYFDVFKLTNKCKTLRNTLIKLLWDLLSPESLIQGYPQQIRFYRRLYGILQTIFLKLMVYCSIKLFAFFDKSNSTSLKDYIKDRSSELKIFSLSSKSHPMVVAMWLTVFKAATVNPRYMNT